MTQQQYPFPPSPYSAPSVDYRAWGMVQPNRPGKSAAIWQLILGGFLFLCGTCVGAAIWIVPDDMMSQAIEQQQTNLPPMANFTPLQEFRLLTTIGSGVMILLGGLLLGFAYFVYRGGKISTICSMLIAILIGFILLLDFASTAVQAASHPAVILPVLFILAILAVTGVTVAKQIAALRSNAAAQTQAMQQAYYWMMQYQQQYAAQNQTGYGYGQPPPAAPTQSSQQQPPTQQIPPPRPPTDPE